MKHTTVNLIKFKRLQRKLKIPKYQAIGILEALWVSCYSNAQDGAIGRLSNEDIAAEIEWEGDADLLINALRDGWLDDAPMPMRLVIHDWSEHCASFLKGNFVNQKREFADKILKSRTIVLDHSPAPRNGTIVGDYSGAVPNLTKPNLTSTTPLPPSGAGNPPPVGGQNFTIPENLNLPEFQKAWSDWIQHRKEIKHALKPTTMTAQLKKLSGMGSRLAIQAIKNSIEHGYIGLFEPNGNSKTENQPKMGLNEKWDKRLQNKS